VLSSPNENVKVRWFVIESTPESTPKKVLDKAVRERFWRFGGEYHIIGQSRHSAMHETHTLDFVCLISGDASLILEACETRLKPGDVVI
jgi:hypothetical protein